MKRSKAEGFQQSVRLVFEPIECGEDEEVAEGGYGDSAEEYGAARA